MEEEKLSLPSEFQQQFEEGHPQDITLTDYLFEPDISKLKDISDFDVETDWIPRIDRFGEYIGDGIVTERSPITKVIFHGFYEDLSEEAPVYMISGKDLSFHRQSPQISFKKLVLPVHVICYNADLLVTDDSRKIENSDVWITPLLDMKGYSVQDKFVLQCFELIRLTRVPQKIAEKIKSLSILSASVLQLTEENFQVAAVSLIYFIRNRFGKNLDVIDTVDNIDWPIFYGFSKEDILANQVEFELVLKCNDYQRYDLFQQKVSQILGEQTNHLQVELSNYLDTFYGKKVLDVYISLIEDITDEFYKLYLFGEFVVGLSRVLPEMVLDFYYSTGLDVIEQNPVKLNLIEDLRLVLITESLLLYDDFIWGPSLIFNLLGSICNFVYSPQKGLDFLHKANHFLKNPRDHILLLYSYLEIVTKVGEYEYGMKIIENTREFLITKINEGKILTYSQYFLLSYFSIRFKQKIQFSTDVLYLLQYLLKIAKQHPLTYPPISPENRVKGLEILQNYLPEFENDDLKLLLQIRSGDIFQTLYRTELYSDSPKLDLLLSICEYYLVITKNINIYSNVYRRQFSYSIYRLKTYFNLFAFYFILKDFEQLELYKREFTLEFADMLDSELFQEFLVVLQSESAFFRFIQNPSNIKKYDIDLSLVYFLKIRSILLDYKIHEDLEKLILQMNETIETIPDFIQYRPKYFGLQILYKSLLKSSEAHPNLQSIKKELKKLATEYSVAEEFLDFNILTEENIDDYLSPLRIPYFLNSYM